MKREKWNDQWIFWNARTPKNVQEVHLPHDAMLTEKRLSGIQNGVATGFYPGGKYYYRKMFYGNEEMQDQTVLLEFGGVYMDSSVYLNGEKVGGRIYGYSRFYVDLTDKICIGKENELLVEADNTHTPNSRWYSGSGIYRDVYLLTAPKAHILPDGIRVTTTGVDPVQCAIDVTVSEAVDGSEVIITVENNGAVLASGKGLHQDFVLETALPWSAEEPNLYQVEAKLVREGEVLDREVIRTGFRTLSWNAKEGMCVNGKHIWLKGGCVHHDHGPLGAVSIYESEVRRARLIKSMGFNAIRYAHNPAGKVFLDACDEVGLYVMDESFDQWKQKQSPYDYGVIFDTEWKQDLTDMIEVARNHPSVVMYSIGNEISDVGIPNGAAINGMLVEQCKRIDPTRPVTNCINPVVAAMGAVSSGETSLDDETDPYEEKKNSQLAGSLLANIIVTVVPIMQKVMGRPDKVEKKLKPVFDRLDIVGYNYAEQCYGPHHEMDPDRLMVGSETYLSHVADNWNYMKKHPYVIGDFVWTVWDYLGEAGIGLPIYGKSHGGFNRPFPAVASGGGLIDLTGMPETSAYYANIFWGHYKKPYIGVRPVNHTKEKYFLGQWRMTDTVHSWSWTGMEGRAAAIEVYSPGSEVELFLNKTSLGRKKVKRYIADYQTIYEPGTLTAVAYDANGNELGRDELLSASEETQITISPEKETMKADGEDLIYVPITLTDTNKICKMLADRKLKVKVSGAASLAGLSSGAASTMDEFTSDQYRTKNGRLLAILRSNGKEGAITLQVSGQGVRREQVTLQAVRK